MTRLLVRGLVVAGLFGAGVVARADEPLPPPRPVPRPMPMPLMPGAPMPEPLMRPPTAFYRPSRYAVWSAYGVNSAGQFRPLVLYGPYNGYYAANGAPYPWAVVKTREFWPTAPDGWPSAGGPWPAPRPWPLMPYAK